MFKSFVFIILAVLPVSLLGQSRYGYLLPDLSIVSTTSLSNTFYTGIDNRLSIYIENTENFDTLLLKCNNGTIYFDSTYFVIPHRAGNLRIEAHGITNQNIDTLGFSNFKVLALPSPKIAFDTSIIKQNMKLSRESFIMADSLFIIFSDDIIGSKYWAQIKEFSIGFNYGGYFIGESSNNNAITEQMKQLVATRGSGRWFSIKVITHTGTSLLLTHPMYRVFFY